MTLLHRRALLRLVATTPLIGLVACGRKADPKPPADADPLAPRIYPVDRSIRPEDRLRRDEIPPPRQQPPALPPTPADPFGGQPSTQPALPQTLTR